MNPKDIVYKMVVLGRRLTTHFILDIFWGSSFMFHVVLGLSRARLTQQRHPNTTGTSNWLLGVNAVAIDTQPITYARGEIKFNRHK